MDRIEFAETNIAVRDYPYPPCTCYPDRTLAATDVVEVSSGYPLRIRLRWDDVLFVAKELENDLLAFAQRNSIPVVHRFDPWDFVLEPFLDTEYTPDRHATVVQMLALNGVTEQECTEWRRRFQKAMVSYNFDSMLWEWCHLGATDLLDAHMGKLAKRKYKLAAGDFAKLYRLVIGVLLRAAEIPREWTSSGRL